MHREGCPQRNNPYAGCECAAIEQREHTYQLQRFNENAAMMQQQQDTIAALTAERDALRKERDDARIAIASIADFINIHALESGATKTERAGQSGIKTAIDSIVFALRERAERAEAQLVAARKHTRLWAYVVGAGKVPVIWNGHFGYVSALGFCEAAMDRAEQDACAKLAALTAAKGAGK